MNFAIKGLIQHQTDVYIGKLVKKRVIAKQIQKAHQLTVTDKMPSLQQTQTQTQTSTVLSQQNDINELKLHISNSQSQMLSIQKNLCLELQFYKNRKHEKFYQKLVEHYFCGTHKKTKLWRNRYNN